MTKQILLLDYIGYVAKERSLAQAIRELGLTPEELERAYAEVTHGREGDYEIYLEVREK